MIRTIYVTVTSNNSAAAEQSRGMKKRKRDRERIPAMITGEESAKKLSEKRAFPRPPLYACHDDL